MGLSAVGGVVLPPEEGVPGLFLFAFLFSFLFSVQQWGEVAQARETKGGEGKEQGYDAAYRGAVRVGIKPWASITLGSTLQSTFLWVDSVVTSAIDAENYRCCG